MKTKPIYMFNIIPTYRPGAGRIFDFGRYVLACLPSLPQRIKQNGLYVGLENITGENLSDLDLLYIFATEQSPFARINWVDPGLFTAQDGVEPTFTANEGFQGNGSSQYLTTGWAPNPDANNFSQNSASAFCYINNDVAAANNPAFGVLGNGAGASNGVLNFYPKRLDTGQYAYRVNTPILKHAGTATSSIGLFHIDRDSSSNESFFKDGALVDNQAFGSTSISDFEVSLFAHNNSGTISGFSDVQIGMFGLGASLAGKESDLYAAWNSYFTSL